MDTTQQAASQAAPEQGVTTSSGIRLGSLTLDRLSVAVVLTAVCAYLAALAGTFVYDDIHAVRDNAAIRSLAAIPSFFWDVDAFSDLLKVRMYRPVVLTTLAIDHFVGGGAAWAFKLTNILVHAGCAALVLSVARALGARRTAAGVAALLFAAHPFASEAINIISSRSDTLATLGILLGLRCYLALRAEPRLRLGPWLGLGVGAVFACGGKETGVMLGPLCLVVEFVRSGARPRALIDDARGILVRLAPVVVVTLAYLAVRKLALGAAVAAAVPHLSGGPDPMNGAGRDLVTQFCLMAYVLPRFLFQSVLPLQMTLDPWIPLHDQWWSWPVLCGWLGVAGLTVLGLRAPRKRPAAFVGTCLAWATALPWIVLPLNLPACEHRFYIPLAGLALIAATVLPATLTARGRAALGATLVVFVGWSAARSFDYRDAEILWRDALAQHPNSIRGLCGLALEHQADAFAAKHRGDEVEFERQLRQAIHCVSRAIVIYPQHWAARRNLAEFQLALRERGEPRLALFMADSLLEAEPDNPFYRLLKSRALTGIAVETRADADFDAAVAVAMSVLEVKDPIGLEYRTAATARILQGRHDLALELLDECVARGLDHSPNLLLRAECALALGLTARARADLRQVLGRDPFDVRAMEMLNRRSVPAQPR